MNLREEILKSHSKAQCDKIVRWVGNSPDRMDQLVKLFKSSEYRVVQRAGWPLSYIAIAHPPLIKKHLPALVKLLNKKPVPDAVTRNILRLLQTVPLPASLQGIVMDACFRFIEDPTQAIAIKAFALTVVTGMAGDYPAIIPEIRLLIESQASSQTAAFKSRAKRSLALFDKIEKRKSKEESKDG